MAKPRALLLALHDVAPCTWRAYLPFIDAVDALGPVPINWLVVPDFHRCHPLDGDPALLALLERRLSSGDELLLHGYYHQDDSPPPRTPLEYLMRRVYTQEGEFYRLSHTQALARLDAGLEVFARHAWPLQGFVAPAWLMSEGTRQALRERPLRYTSTPRHLYRLPDFTALKAPGLVWSARNAWRRDASWLLCKCLEIHWREAPVIRLGLHPLDMQHPLACRYWLGVVQRLLEQGRLAMTKSAWLAAQAGSSSC